MQEDNALVPVEGNTTVPQLNADQTRASTDDNNASAPEANVLAPVEGNTPATQLGDNFLPNFKQYFTDRHHPPHRMLAIVQPADDEAGGVTPYSIA